MKIERNNIYDIETIEGMRHIKDKSIKLIFTDLPFGTTKNLWDIKIDEKLLWEQYERIIEDNGAIVLFAQSPFDKTLACSNLKLFRYEWIWEKTHSTGFLNATKMPMKSHENILVFYKKLPTYNPIMEKGHRKVSRASHKTNCRESSNYGKQMHTKDYDSDERYPRSVLKFKGDKQLNNLHPTQKPIKLLEYIIKTYTNKGDLVLDNCIGSGGTAVASVNTGRDYIGFDNGTCAITFRKFADIAKDRVLEAKGMVNLFALNQKSESLV